jgi:2-desacetyl-2-hydroxyethyl bacteriochlorophyllide A dehydrogenase
MYKTLAPYAIGVKAKDLEESLAAAKKGGFEGLEFNVREIAERVDSEGADAVRARFEDAGILPAAFGLAVEWRKSEEEWRRGLAELPRLARAAAAIGCTRTATWVLSFSDELPPGENRRFHVERFKPIAAILNEHGIRLGLEFLGPKTMRNGKKYAFIHTLGGMLDMAAEIGPNVGVLLDAWHWYTSGGTLDDIKRLRPEQVVYVHVNDAPPYIPLDEQVDNKRRVPATTGIIDIAGFLRALRKIGYDGPVTPEPFDAELNELPSDDDRLGTVGWAMSAIFDKAGVVSGWDVKVVQGVRANIVAERSLRFQWFEVPAEPKGSQVLLKLERTIISAGTELANYTGLDSDTRVPGAWCYYPWRPGYGGIGRILAAGPDAPADLTPGKRVYGIFNHASHTLVDPGWQICVPVPDELDSSTAVMARIANVAITAIQRARLAPGDTVAIIGLGLVGNLAGQFFLRAGHRVIGLDPFRERRSLAEQVGFTATLDPSELLPDITTISEKERARRVKEIGGGTQPAVVVDAVGDSRLVEQAVFAVADNGQVIMLGTPRAAYESNCTVALKRAHFRGISIVGALEWKIPLLKRQSNGFTTEGNAEKILQMITSRELQVTPLRSHVLPPADLGKAYEGLLNRKGTYLGVVLDWENNPLPEGED